MKTKLTLLAIVSVAAIMSIGAIAPALANDEDEAQVAIDKTNEALDVACEKIEKEIEILDDKDIDVPKGLEDFAKEVCDMHFGPE